MATVFEKKSVGAALAQRMIAAGEEKAAAMGHPFVIAIVGQPCARASATTDHTSGEAPDCEIPITSAESRRGGVW